MLEVCGGRLRIIGMMALVSCSGGTDTDTDTSWYPTCGPPVCETGAPPPEGVPECTEADAEGAACANEGATCVVPPADGCALVLQCSTAPLIDSGVGCPISRKEHKRDIDYLEPGDVARAAEEVGDLRLATWRYTWEPAEARPHLGILIDDHPASVAVAPGGRTVDLYGYTSLAVAGVQAQQAELAAMRAELASVRAEVAALRAGSCAAEAPSQEGAAPRP